MYEILFQYGPVTITTINLFILISFIFSAVFLIRFIQLKKMKLSFFINNFIYFIVLPLIAGRIFYIFENFYIFKNELLQIFIIWDFGFSSLGMFYIGFLTLFILSKIKKEDFWGWLDAFTISGLVGLFFIHIGHFFNGTHYGAPTDLPWGIAFDTPIIPFTNPIHPTQLYSAIIAFIIFGFSMKFVKRTHLTGLAGTLAIVLYSLSVFGIDFLHGSPSIYYKINYIIIAILAFIFYIHCSYKKHFD